MLIDVESLDKIELETSDIVHVRVNSNDTKLLNNIRGDLQSKFYNIYDKFLVTPDGIKMQKFSIDELKAVRDDIDKVIGRSPKPSPSKSSTSKKDVIAFRVRNKKTGKFERSSNGKTIWLRWPGLSYFSKLKELEIVKFKLVEM